jgi:predicted unusual protein kinase regulating ubiquinone biosynthesis (AarF/ABC1/UbiB family)
MTAFVAGRTAAVAPGRRRLLDAGTFQKQRDQAVGPDVANLSEGEKLRNVLTELGTTWVKFGQMLSLRPDVVGADVAVELEQLRAAVPPGPPGVAQQTVEKELGKPVSELYASFEKEPFASGSVAQVHRASSADGTSLAVKVVHTGAAERVHEDLELMAGLASNREAKDPELAQLRPTILIDEFTKMTEGAINLGEELHNLQLFHANFANEPDARAAHVGWRESGACTGRVVRCSHSTEAAERPRSVRSTNSGPGEPVDAAGAMAGRDDRETRWNSDWRTRSSW